jgi:hypothetical protein
MNNSKTISIKLIFTFKKKVIVYSTGGGGILEFQTGSFCG